MKGVFFGVISLMLVTVAVLEFFLSYELKNQCEGHNILTAPTVAGACLTGSFLFNMIWLKARKKNAKNAIRAALFAWTVSVTVGVAAAGAALGQALLLPEICVSEGQSTLEMDLNLELLHYSAIALLVLSVAAPHALKKKGATVEASEESNPLIKRDLESKPLVFL
jgi:hypothetical protein